MMKLLEKIGVGGATDLCLVAGWANKGKYKGIMVECQAHQHKSTVLIKN